MSKTFFVSLASVLSLWTWMPTMAPQAGPLPDVLQTHGHPQKSHYLSRAEWPLASTQAHWQEPGMASVAHAGHVECRGPWFAEVPRVPFTLDCQIQMFHVAGGLWGTENGSNYGLFGHRVSQIEWQRFGPNGERIADNSLVIGDPNGVVVRPFRITIDPAMSAPNGSGGPPIPMPENGWFQVVLTAYFQLANGSRTEEEFSMPLYVRGDPGVPETIGEFGYQFKVSSRAAVFSPNSGNAHGVSIAEYIDTYLPIAPLTAPYAVKGQAASYARVAPWPAPEFDSVELVLDADLHNGNPGTSLLKVPPSSQADVPTVVDVVFPTTVAPGAHKLGLIWNHKTGAGSPGIGAGESISSLLVWPFAVGTVTPPPPPDPIDCQIAWGTPVMTGTAAGLRPFTVTVQPANGGKSCVTVASGG